MQIDFTLTIKLCYHKQHFMPHGWSTGLGAFLMAAAIGGNAAGDTAVGSPNGRVQLHLNQASDGRLAFRVTFNGRPAIDLSPLAIMVDGMDIAAGADVGNADRYSASEKYTWRGVHSEAVNRYQGARIAVKHRETGTAYTLDVRAFDDGVAFRYVVPGEGKTRVPDETTAFVIPEGSTVWYHDLEGHYETVHTKKDVADVTAGEWAAPPLTFRLASNAGYGSITEAALFNFAGMGLQAGGGRAFQVKLGHAQHVSYPFRLRYKDDVERLSKPAAVTGTITSPWRVVLLGADLNTLVNSYIVHNLAPPPDPKLFPRGLATEWVKPGRSVWRYLDGGDNSFEGIKEFSRLAGELGFEYNLLEGFWQKWTDDQLREMVGYSKARNVGIWLWKHSRDLRTPEARKTFFGKCQMLGIAGAKIDFFDHEAKEVIELYETLLREAAAHRVMVNFHGANKPAGEPRTYPNEMTREGVYGMEHRKGEAWGKHNTTIPFTRYLAGHGDYTPVVFGDRRRETSWAHQIATAAVFTSPLLVYGGHPKSLLENPAVEIIKSIPAVWDETRVLPFSEIGEVAGFARRSGKTWFVAILNGPIARKVRVDLTFLGDGAHDALLASDNPDGPAAVGIDRQSVRRRTQVDVALRVGGGFIARLTPAFAR